MNWEEYKKEKLDKMLQNIKFLEQENHSKFLGIKEELSKLIDAEIKTKKNDNGYVKENC